MSFVRVTVVNARGSVPRGAGTAMVVHPDRIEGTIGGGALEWAAMEQARAMLANGERVAERVMPLGPVLGQCCGGSVELRFERDAPLETETRPLWIWGAGHVGRALVSVLAPFEDLSLTWIDMDADRFPQVPDGVTPMIAVDMPAAAPRAPDPAEHLILTHSHRIDLALCDALMSRPTGPIGLIGSETKWARFQHRLRALGHSPAQISRIRCPIGQKSLGKHPQAIAVGVAAALLDPVRSAERRAV